MKAFTSGILAAVSLSALAVTMTFRAAADPAAGAAKQEKLCTGMVAAIDAKDRTLGVRGFFSTKKFNLGQSCVFTLADRNAGAIDDLRPGQKVTVSYFDAGGVLVADAVVQLAIRSEGVVKTINPEKHELTLHLRAGDKVFAIADDCKIVLHDESPGTLDDVNAGHHVTVVYELPSGAPVAREIDQTSATFNGSLTALDASDRTIKAKHMTGTSKFFMADGCTIVVNGKTGGQLSDLKLGDKIALSYDEVDGVKVVNRIALQSQPGQPMTAASGK
jgi:Cu/Ag efflux protein CusF